MRYFGLRWNAVIALLALAGTLGCQSLNGKGTAPQSSSLVVSPATLDFGTVVVGSSKTLTDSLVNSTASSITVNSVTATDASFKVTGQAFPLTLAAGQSAALSITFTPKSAGHPAATLAITSAMPGDSTTASLSATAVLPGQLTVNPSSISFGTVQVGSSQTNSGTFTNSGGSDLTITQVMVSGSEFQTGGTVLPLTLAPGKSSTFTVTFTPSVTGAASGTISVAISASLSASNQGNQGSGNVNQTVTISVTGNGALPGQLTANPASLSFGNVQVGNTSSKFETLTNTSNSNVTISQATVTGTGFSISGLSLPLTLTAGQSVTFNAAFTPQSSSSASGNISVASNATNPTLTVSLSGTGTAAGQLSVAPATLNFGSVVVGASATLTGTLSASGSSVTVSSATSSSPEFVLSAISFPLTIAAGQSAGFTATFRPQASGAASASLSFASNASNSPTVQSLTGTGTPPPQHSVSLSWNASTSVVVGYYVYRGAQTGGPYTKINPSSDPNTTYTDNAVTAGQTYYYVTTAVDSGGSESVYSNEVKAVIPIP